MDVLQETEKADAFGWFIKQDGGEEKFKTREKCFQMHRPVHFSSLFFVFHRVLLEVLRAKFRAVTCFQIPATRSLRATC